MKRALFIAASPESAEGSPPKNHSLCPLRSRRLENQRPAPAHLRAVQVLTGIVIIGALAAAVYFRDRLQELAAYGYTAVFLVGLLSNATIILPIPGLAVSSVMGGVFNPWLVGIVAGIGQALGELSGYMLGYSGQTLIANRPIYNRIQDWMRRWGVWVIFVLAAIPNPVFDVGGMIAGALRFPVWKFLTSCAAGKILKNILFALAGYYGIEAILRLLGR
ncbi:MAG: VTT domain-containing protein [Anaerolineae bacterium]|nr:VTT domain-containing protein [Anaerolineae bacterium]